MTEHMLTTVDNPFDPFTQFDAWYAYDVAKGYHTSALLARVAFTSDELSDVDQSSVIEAAIDEVVSENVSGMHRKVTPEFFNSTTNA
jgi:hypothetical protein